MINGKQVIYIAGKITGTTDYMQRFGAAERYLLLKGAEVMNPTAVNAHLPEGSPYRLYMDVGLSMLNYADAIYMLNGWEKSRGAREEFAYAVQRGITVIFEGDDETIQRG